jgi:Ca2+-binding EF-hand superfamily protein
MAAASANNVVAESFERLDLNHDGFLEQEDLTRYTDELISQFGRSPDSQAAQKFMEVGQQAWQRLQSAIDANNDQRISKEEFIEFHSNMSPGEFDSFADAIFELADSDDNNVLTKDEFRKLQQVRGENNPSYIEEVFSRYDEDNDGALTRAEYRRYLEENTNR